jgi:hypothetical protein
MQTLETKLPAQIAEFCSHCDYKENMNVCPYDKRQRYVARDMCGKSDIQGIKVLPVTKDSIVYKGISYKRTDIADLIEKIEQRK